MNVQPGNVIIKCVHIVGQDNHSLENNSPHRKNPKNCFHWLFLTFVWIVFSLFSASTSCCHIFLSFIMSVQETCRINRVCYPQCPSAPPAGTDRPCEQNRGYPCYPCPISLAEIIRLKANLGFWKCVSVFSSQSSSWRYFLNNLCK